MTPVRTLTEAEVTTAVEWVVVSELDIILQIEFIFSEKSKRKLTLKGFMYARDHMRRKGMQGGKGFEIFLCRKMYSVVKSNCTMFFPPWASSECHLNTVIDQPLHPLQLQNHLFLFFVLRGDGTEYR